MLVNTPAGALNFKRRPRGLYHVLEVYSGRHFWNFRPWGDTK